MYKVIESVQSNPCPKIICAEQETFIDLVQLDPLDLSENKKYLAALYLNNSLEDVCTFWRFYRDDNALILLDSKLGPNLKRNLEDIYAPLYLYDPSRSEIKGYEPITLMGGQTQVFRRARPVPISIHGKIKILLSTSGTTGSPKLVKLCDENLYQNALSIIDYLPIRSSDNTPLILPIYYSYGLSVLLSNCMAGGNIYCTNKNFLDRKLWSEFEKFGYTSMAGVPFSYEVLNRIGFLRKVYPSLRYLTQAGGKLNDRLREKFTRYAQAHGIEFYVMYGQTEATARISYLAPDQLDAKGGSIGRPIKNGNLSIDPEIGELLYEGPNVFGGYATCVEELGSYRPPKVLRTGDLGRVDEDGYYYITGRLKRFMKIAGLRVNLDDVQDQLQSTLGCGELAVLAIDDESLYVVLINRGIETAQIRNVVLDLFNINPAVVNCRHIDKLPLTSSGKVNYKAIEEML